MTAFADPLIDNGTSPGEKTSEVSIFRQAVIDDRSERRTGDDRLPSKTSEVSAKQHATITNRGEVTINTRP
jgi:hypothetical protein